MSNLKKDIDELVRSVVTSIGYYAMHGKTDKEATDLAVIAVSKEIINLIESVIPEPDKHTWRAYGQPDGTVVCDHCNLAEDVNNLLSSQVADIKSRLIGEE